MYGNYNMNYINDKSIEWVNLDFNIILNNPNSTITNVKVWLNETVMTNDPNCNIKIFIPEKV
jgi:hypothetical protein